MLRIAIALGFCSSLCIALVVGEENMGGWTDFVMKRWMMKNDTRDKKMERDECTEHHSTFERSSIRYI